MIEDKYMTDEMRQRSVAIYTKYSTEDLKRRFKNARDIYLKNFPHRFKINGLATKVDDDYLEKAYSLFMKYGAEWFLDDRKKYSKTQINHFYSYFDTVFRVAKNGKRGLAKIFYSHYKCIGDGKVADYTEDDIDYTKYNLKDKYVAFEQRVENLFSFNKEQTLTLYLWNKIEFLIFMEDDEAVRAVDGFMNWCKFKNYV